MLLLATPILWTICGNTKAEQIQKFQMNNQLRAMKELGAIKVESSLPLEPHGIPYPEANSPKRRMDNWLAYPSPEKLLSQAPEVDEGYIIVPEIPHKDLG